MKKLKEKKIEKKNSIFRKSPKTLCLGHFGTFLPIFEKMRIFPKNMSLSLFYVYGPLTSCKKLEKNNEPILRTLRHGQTDGQTDDTEFIGPSRCKRGSKKKMAKISKTGIFLKKGFRVNLNTRYCSLTSCKISK